ncbi:hypothetical protein M3J09_000726 [Ascochyta lentis]
MPHRPTTTLHKPAYPPQSASQPTTKQQNIPHAPITSPTPLCMSASSCCAPATTDC